MNQFETDYFVIAQFAKACERLNDFKRSLRDAGRFYRISGNADIRFYESGWRLEKYVEAEFRKKDGRCAVWWLELGTDASSLLISSFLEISPEILRIHLTDRKASSREELEQQLQAAVDELIGAEEQNARFSNEIERILNTTRNI